LRQLYFFLEIRLEKYNCDTGLGARAFSRQSLRERAMAKPIPRAPDRSRLKRRLLSTAPVSAKRDQRISTEPVGDSQEMEGDRRSVDELSEDQAVAGVPRWSPSADEPRPKRRRSTPLAQMSRDYLNRVELLTLVPLSMSSIDAADVQAAACAPGRRSRKDLLVRGSGAARSALCVLQARHRSSARAVKPAASVVGDRTGDMGAQRPD